MAKMRRADSKTALARQRSEVRRGARGKAHVGDDTGSAAARAAEREKVHRMQELQREHEAAAAHQREQEAAAHRREEDSHRQALVLAAQRQYRASREQHAREPIGALFGELLTDSLRLARTFVLLPFRILSALRGHGPRASEA